MHKWWARRLGSVFRSIILYSLADETLTSWDQNSSTLWNLYPHEVDLSGKVVLDPMMGGGTTVVEALRFGCKVIAGDLNPVAWFIVKKELEDINPQLFTKALEQLEDELGAEIRQYYRTKCPECGDSAEGIYYFYYKELVCTHCVTAIPLMRNFVLAKSLTNDGDSVICPQCWGVFDTKNAESETKCPGCGNTFVPRETSFTNGREFSCRNEECQDGRIVDWIRRNGRPKERMYAIEFHCKTCEISRNLRLKNGRGYKAPDELDLGFLEQAKKEFIMKEELLPIPGTAIPLGVETKRALNHGYSRFRDMFNERQLLNLGKIYNWILTIDDQNLKEFLVLAFSNSLKYNNMFAKYNATRGFITDIFRTHSYSPSMAPVEANCYDTAKGRGAFTAFVNLVVEGKEYCRAPFERVIDEGSVVKIQTGRPIATELASDYGEIGDDRRALLQCGSSESINIPDGVVDAVITDPPYYGNVMYSELSNFFYVWLKLALQDSYEYFREKLVPWKEEVIENRAQKKGEDEFLTGLTKLFSEACRVLRNDGVLVFTFHHKKEEAWAAVLQAILDSGFYVTTIYPVRSEMKASTHLHDMENITYDMVIVCRKRGEKIASAEWSFIKKTISRTTRQTLDHLVKNGEQPGSLDVFVMALGKCLEHYSKHYPNIIHGGRRIGVREALDSIRDVMGSEIRQRP